MDNGGTQSWRDGGLRVPLRSAATSLPATVDYGKDEVEYDSVGEGDEQRKGLVYQDAEMKGYRPLGTRLPDGGSDGTHAQGDEHGNHG